MVGLSISLKVMPIPLAMAAASPNISEILAMDLHYRAGSGRFVKRSLAADGHRSTRIGECVRQPKLCGASHGGSIFRASTRLPLGKFFIRLKRRHSGPLANGFHLPFHETLRRHRNGPILLDQEHGWYVGYSEGVAGGIIFVLPIEQHRQFRRVGLLKFRGASLVILRNADDL